MLSLAIRTAAPSSACNMVMHTPQPALPHSRTPAPLAAAATLLHTSATLPGRQVVPVTIYHLSMTHAHRIHAHTHTHTTAFCYWAHQGAYVCVRVRVRESVCGPQAKAFNMQFMFATRSITGNSHMPSTHRYVEAWASHAPKNRRNQASEWAHKLLLVGMDRPCGKSKSSSKTKLDYFVRSVWSEV